MPVSRPELVIIAAIAEKNRVIGKEGDLPWHIPEDLKRFKRLTTGYPLLMGRKTFESIVKEFGGPLPDRRHLVLTSRGELPAFPDIETYSSIADALEAVQSENMVFIGGGQAIYEQFLTEVDRMELTLIEGGFEGDAFFPPFEHLVGELFEVDAIEPHDGFRFVTYRRIRA